MRRAYDIFERFPDGSSLWRTFAVGRFEAKRRMHELAEHSGNDFFLNDIPTEEFLPTVPARKITRPLTKSAAA